MPSNVKTAAESNALEEARIREVYARRKQGPRDAYIRS